MTTALAVAAVAILIGLRRARRVGDGHSQDQNGLAVVSLLLIVPAMVVLGGFLVTR
ncbi:hypothetical protein [Amycolatopsis nalaikhensis]|uniref:Uncharacterized protein n=1 Tax=Amycolatopsis nalaikhensis TaxID=715472 RepID=A0ABY8XU90_9PSEU|nr:hypothetical protein [Amycolatopsis sp. 2-2]WIV59259.1 hypothetical protein QP939_11830 [Amycolatopsis sp. 2-2]